MLLHTFFSCTRQLILLTIVNFSFLLLTTEICLADDDSLLDRNRHAGRRAARFYSTDIVRHSVALSGEYDSDEDSKQQVVKFEHYYRSNKFISDTELSLDTIYEEQRPSNSSDRNTYLIKERDLFKLITSQKLALFSSSWYGIFFNETRHDNESDIAYQDIVTSGGLGKSFFDRNLEFDISYGLATGRNITDTTYESQRRNYKRSVIVPSFRYNYVISKNIRIVHRGYAYFSDAIDSYYLTTRLNYKLSRKLYFQISHLFDKRTYDLYDKNTSALEKSVNEIRRQVIFGLRYEFGAK